MGTKGIRLKTLLPLMVAIVLADATGSLAQLDPEVNLPAIVFRKEHGTPAKLRGATLQKDFCAAFPLADGRLLTSAHCLATAPRSKRIDMVGVGNVEVETTNTHSKLDLAVFQLKDRNLIPEPWHVELNSEGIDDTCSVLVLNEAFRWTVLHEATPTRCVNNVSKDRICFKSETVPTGLDFAVVCDGGQTLHAVFHGQRGAEVSFTDCSTDRCSEFVKRSVITRVKRQSDQATDDVSIPSTNDTADTSTADAPATNVVDQNKTATDPPPKDAAIIDASSTDSQSALVTDLPVKKGDVPLPPPHQMFPNMPKNFPYPTIDVVQSPPVPTRPRKRPGLHSPYPVQTPKENPFPDIPTINPEPPLNLPNQLPQQTNEQPAPAVSSDADVSVQLPMRTEPSEGSDLTEYEVLGTQDQPVLPANNNVKDPVASPQQAVVPDVYPEDVPAPHPAPVHQRAPAPSGGGFAMAPADWRFSVTPRPQRRCKTTTSRPRCPAPQPYPPAAGAYNNGQMAAVPPPLPAVNYPPNQAMGPVAAGASRPPVGPDPWMEAAQQAVTAHQGRQDTTEKPADSSADRNGLAVVALFIVNVLYLML